MATIDIDLQALRNGDRRILAKAITLIESIRPDDRLAAQSLLESLLPYTGNSIRIGVSGAPGVGKSTFIEAFGQLLIAKGKKVAILAIDPSSPIVGGSILGDKTRMEILAREPNAYIRPSPSAGELGGVAEKTRESILACEAAGFDAIIVETVGVGQSEIEAASMVDIFLVLIQPNSGDELQGIKKGILEIADVIIVNKADGNSKLYAEQAKQHYENAISLFSNGETWIPRVMQCSALKNEGIAEIWQLIEEFRQVKVAENEFTQNRAQQNKKWLEKLLLELVTQKLQANEEYQQLNQQLEEKVVTQQTTPLVAAKLLADFL